MRLHRSVAVVVAALAFASPAAAGKTAVGSPAQFRAAVASMRATGGVVVLEPGRYPHLTVGRRPAGHALSSSAAVRARASVLSLSGAPMTSSSSV